MARIDVKTTVTAPDEINVPLIRADHAATANIFRIFFEFFLSLSSVLLGHILSLGLKNLLMIHWAFLVVCFLAVVVFLILSFHYGKSNIPKKAN